MQYDLLRTFIATKMRMSHVYQPVMIRALLESNGRTTVEAIAKALLAEDRSQIEYYEAAVKNMVGHAPLWGLEGRSRELSVVVSGTRHPTAL